MVCGGLDQLCSHGGVRDVFVLCCLCDVDKRGLDIPVVLQACAGRLSDGGFCHRLAGDFYSIFSTECMGGHHCARGADWSDFVAD